MDLLLLVALGAIWAAFIIPAYGEGRRKVPTSPRSSVEEFEREMDSLAGADGNVGTEERRFVVSPRKGTQFLGPKERKRQRVRERRKKILVVLAEATFFTFLIGLAPPFRPMLAVAALLAAGLGGYCWLLVRIKQIEGGTAHASERVVPRSGRTAAAAQVGYGDGHRYVAEGQSTVARASYAGLSTLGEGDDAIHVIVREN